MFGLKELGLIADSVALAANPLFSSLPAMSVSLLLVVVVLLISPSGGAAMEPAR